jgi:hypothetical protein
VRSDQSVRRFLRLHPRITHLQHLDLVLCQFAPEHLFLRTPAPGLSPSTLAAPVGGRTRTCIFLELASSSANESSVLTSAFSSRSGEEPKPLNSASDGRYSADASRGASSAGTSAPIAARRPMASAAWFGKRSAAPFAYRCTHIGRVVRQRRVGYVSDRFASSLVWTS